MNVDPPLLEEAEGLSSVRALLDSEDLNVHSYLRRWSSLPLGIPMDTPKW
jgi:hypothetical protein